jgi:hypothetical protein
MERPAAPRKVGGFFFVCARVACRGNSTCIMLRSKFRAHSMRLVDMARRNTDEAEPILMLGTEAESDDLRVEDKIKAEFNQSTDATEWKIVVSRFEGVGKQEPECFICTPNDFPITGRLREEHGAGKFRVRVYKDGKQIHFFQYAIEAARTNAATAVKSELSTMAAAFQASMDRQSALIERLMERIGSQRQGGAQQGTMLEMVQALVAMKDLTAPPPAPENTSRDTLLEVFKLGLEASGNGGGSSESSGMMGFAERLLSSPIVQKIVESATAAMPAPRPNQVPAPQRLAGPTAGTEGDATGAVQTDEQRAAQIQAFMRQQILYLLGRAAQWRTSGMQKSHPDLYAEWVLDNIPMELLQPILNSPNAIQLLQGFVPEVENFVDWFVALIESIRQGLTEEADEVDKGARLNGGSAPPDVSATSGTSASELTGRP